MNCYGEKVMKNIIYIIYILFCSGADGDGRDRRTDMVGLQSSGRLVEKPDLSLHGFAFSMKTGFNLTIVSLSYGGDIR